MKLYATVASERATKGQGGKRLEITIQGGEFRDILCRFEVLTGEKEQLPFYNKIIDGDIIFLKNLKSNIAFYLDTKGKKQKGKQCDICGIEHTEKNNLCEYCENIV